ncbi:alcohol dehydrogenase catalytic domain-containing protein [Carnobacteriaceae bacterium 52-44]
MDLNKKMKSIAVIENKKVDILESSLPKIYDEEILVKLRGCMLCTFEQRIFSGVVPMPLPFIPGHEIVGEVAHLGKRVDSKDWEIGQKVVIRLLNSCGECYYCRRNFPNLCVKSNEGNKGKTEIPGMAGLSEYLTVKPSQLWKVPDSTPDEVASFAEPLACVVNGVQRADITMGDDVVIVGGGIMGQLFIQLAKLQGARVILSEPDEERRRLGEKNGADVTINPMEVNPVEWIHENTAYGAEVVIVAVALPQVAQQAIDFLAPTGKLIYYSSIHPADDILFNPNDVHKTEKVITGAMSPTIQSFDVSVNLLKKGLVNPRMLLSNKYSIENAQAAFEEALDPKSMRIYIDFTN